MKESFLVHGTALGLFHAFSSKNQNHLDMNILTEVIDSDDCANLLVSFVLVSYLKLEMACPFTFQQLKLKATMTNGMVPQSIIL